MRVKTVLVIDDDSGFRKSLTGVLKQSGYQALEAANGREALERLREMPKPRVVVVDWSMPEMDGLDFIRTVRAQPAYEDVPILMATTETDLSYVARALEAGANEYVMKPFSKRMIRDQLALLGVDPD